MILCLTRSQVIGLISFVIRHCHILAGNGLRLGAHPAGYAYTLL